MWCGQHLAPSGIQTFRVKNTASRSSEETTIEPTTRWARHTQHNLQWISSRVEKQIRFVYSWDDPVAFNCKVIVFGTDGDGVAESFTVVLSRPLGANVSIGSVLKRINDVEKSMNVIWLLPNLHHFLRSQNHRYPCSLRHHWIRDFLFAIFCTNNDKRCTPWSYLLMISSYELTWTSEKTEMLRTSLHWIDLNERHTDINGQTFSQTSSIE